MHWAAQYGYVKVMQILVDNGASIESCDEVIRRVLHQATMAISRYNRLNNAVYST